MRTYIIRRLVLSIPSVLLVLLLIFFMLRILPGDIAEVMLLGSQFSGGGGLQLPPAVRDAFLKELGLDNPIHIQLAIYYWDVLRGDLGHSLYTGKSVWYEIGQHAPITLQIALMGQVIGLLLGIPIGVMTAIKQDKLADYILRLITILFLAIPSFWLGLLVLIIGASVFNWMPPPGANLLWAAPLKNLQQTIWPAMILGGFSTAVVARMTRSTMLEVMREDYIRTARAKGLAELIVIMRHALKNALIPVLTLVGLSFGNQLAGTVVLERVFTIPGMGTMFITAINTRDYPVVQGIVFVIAVGFVVINLVVDLLYGWLDPRIRFAS